MAAPDGAAPADAGTPSAGAAPAAQQSSGGELDVDEQDASPAASGDRSRHQRFEVASPRLPAAERAAVQAEAGSSPPEAQSGGSCSALVQDERQPLSDNEAAETADPDERGKGGSIGSVRSTSSSEPSPHGRLAEAYAHLSTSADAEDHQVPLHTLCVQPMAG